MKTNLIYYLLILVCSILPSFYSYRYKYHDKFSYKFNNKQSLKFAQRMYLMMQSKIKHKLQFNSKSKLKTQFNNRFKLNTRLQNTNKIRLMNKHKHQSKYQISNNESLIQLDSLLLQQEQQTMENQIIQKYIDKQTDFDIKDAQTNDNLYQPNDNFYQSQSDHSIQLEQQLQEPKPFQISLQIKSLSSGQLLSAFSDKYMACNNFGIYYMDANNYQQEDIAQYGDGQQVGQLYSLQNQLCFDIKDQLQDQLWMICGDNQSINQFYQQINTNANLSPKNKPSNKQDQITFDKIEVDLQTVRNNNNNVNQCQSDQQIQSPAPLNMLFALQNVNPPVFKYHGSNDIQVTKSADEYSFDSDFGSISYANQSYCAWRIQIKYPAEHKLPQIKQTLNIKGYKEQDDKQIMELVVYHRLGQFCDQRQKEDQILKEEGQLLVSFFVISQATSDNAVGVFWTSLINYDLQKGLKRKNEQINSVQSVSDKQNTNDYPLALDIEALVDEGISIAFPLSFYQYQGSLSVDPCTPCERILFYQPIYLHPHLFESVKNKLRNDFRKTDNTMEIRPNSRPVVQSNMNENLMVWRWVDPQSQIKKTREINQMLYQDMPINIYSSISRKVYKLKKIRKQTK